MLEDCDISKYIQYCRFGNAKNEKCGWSSLNFFCAKNLSIHHAVDAKLFKNAKNPILSTLAGSDHNEGKTYPKRIKPQTERMIFQLGFPYPHVLRIECRRYEE